MNAAARRTETLRRFATRPSDLVIEDFFNHLRETGRPDTWQYHDPSTPCADTPYIELKPFEIPTKLREKVGRSSCPICSPHAPKYYSGVLCWFPEEHAIRAIGHECARTHFGDVASREARRAGAQHWAIQGAQDFLLDLLPLLGPYRSEARHLYDLAVLIDRCRQQMMAKSSKSALQKLYSLGKTGHLPIDEEKVINEVNRYGELVARSSYITVANVPVEGIYFLKWPIQMQSRALSVLDGLAKMPDVPVDNVLEFITEELADPEHLFEADRISRNMLQARRKTLDMLDEARAFLAPSNLARIAEWSRDKRVASPLRLRFDPTQPDELRVCKPTGSLMSAKRIAIPNMRLGIELSDDPSQRK